MTNDSGDGTFRDSSTQPYGGPFPTSHDVRYPAQQFLRMNHRIGLTHGIAAGEERRAVKFFHHAVRANPSIAAAQNNVPFGHITDGRALYHKRIARPNRGQHAPAGHLQSQPAPRAQDLAGEFTPGSVKNVRTMESSSHDALGVLWQPPPPPTNFPQERAVVTKTCS
jgi:hypothetical protein